MSVSCPKEEAVRGEFVLRKQDDHETPFQAPLQDCKPRTVKVEGMARKDHKGEGLAILCIKRENA